MRARLPGLVLVMGAGLLFAVSGSAFARASTPPERVIVVLKEGSGLDRVLSDHGIAALQRFQHALNGFVATLPPAAVAALARDGRIASIELDQVVQTFAQTTPTGVTRTFAEGNGNLDIDGADDRRVDVDVAIIDTGIDLDHPDLNVVAGRNCMSSTCTSGGDDDNGHGTHVAGTVGALDNGVGVVGVAPGARLWSVKVLGSNGSGYISWIVAGIDWVTANADSIEVANMSLGCACTSSAMNTAIANSVARGVVYAVAAGNSDTNASSHSPANHPDVITVSALADFNGLPGGGAAPTCRSDQDDTLADFSNYGSVVEIAAPGVCILSTVRGGGYSSNYSGTSMASPHVAGAAALLASVNNPGDKADADSIRSTLVGTGNDGWTDDSGDGIKEPLLDVSDTGVFAPAMVEQGTGGTPPANASPTASFTSSCSGLTCQFSGSGTDTDGTITGYAWNLGNGATATGQSVSYTYAASGTYTVTLTVTDDDGATGSASNSVSVTAPEVTLTATGRKSGGSRKYVDLRWSGATTSSVRVFRDGSRITTTTNDGFYTHSFRTSSTRTYRYKVCEYGGAGRCSPEVSVTI